MPTVAEKTVIEHLQRARALEGALVQTLVAHIGITPHGHRYRNTLERHLDETKQHARQIAERLEELGEGRNILQAGVGLAEVLIGQLLASAKAPLDLLRGPRGEEKLLANARDEFVSEALEIATYIALEEAARAAKDAKTARLAASILKDEEHMSDSLRREIPTLTKAVLAAREGHSSYVARAEGEVKGALASEQDLAIENYDQLKVGEIDERLPKLSQIELAKIDAFERKNKDRATVLSKIAALQDDEPWPGYDELKVDEIQAVMTQSENKSLERDIRDYERVHKNRVGVLDALEAAPASG